MLEARSTLEARLFVELQRCPQCQERGFTAPSRMISVGDQLGVMYRGYCPSCGADRSYELVLRDDAPPAGEIGGSDPSTLIDAGQWMWLASERASSVPGSSAGLDRDARVAARATLLSAIAALREARKFIAGDAEAPDRSALFSEHGRDVYLADPGRFSKLRIDAVLEAWTRLADELAA